MQDDLARIRGERAEEVSNWYFRLNGFLSIPGFIVHPDRRRKFPRTEADLIAVRFPYSEEELDGRIMVDDQRLTNIADQGKTLFILVEVKAGLCRINGPWSDPRAENMQRVLRRLGFAPNAYIDDIAETMYAELRWENDYHVLQYIAVGSEANPGIQDRYPRLLQITWNDIGDFLLSRFRAFPQKLPDGGTVHAQWPDFGREYGSCVWKLQSPETSTEAVRSYIQSGSCVV